MKIWKKIFKKKVRNNSIKESSKPIKNRTISELFEIIKKTNNLTEHNEACTEIGIIIRVSKNQEETQKLIDLLNARLTKNKRDNILNAISYCYKGNSIDVSPIFKILKKNKQWSIQEKAISALRNYSNKSIDEIMNYLLKNSNDEYILTRVNAILNEYGNRSNIPYLKLNLNRKGKKTNDTIRSAMLAIIAIGDIREQDLFIEYLNKGRLKNEALEGLCLYGNEKAINPIIKWTKHRIKNKPKRFSGALFFNQKLPIQIALEFLDGYKDKHNEINEFYNDIGITNSKEFNKFI